jgi:WD40 repeat protein
VSRTEEIRDRKLLIIAVGEYPDGGEWEKLDVESETRVWREWLTDAKLGRRAFTPIAEDLARSPDRGRLQELLGDRSLLHPRDAVICYITGHGEIVNGAHRLVLPDSQSGLGSTMQETRLVLEWLKDSGVHHALVVVDTCHAGQVAEALARLDTELPSDWLGIATASPRKQARLGALTDAITRFVRAGEQAPLQEYLAVHELLAALREGLQGQRARVLTDLPDLSSRPVFLPNRFYDPAKRDRVSIGGPRQDLAILEGDLHTHWEPRARGVATGEQSGFFFTGRRRLMQELIAAARGEPGAWVVTGTAGSGKSAVLSRLVTFSDSEFAVEHAALLAAVPEQLRPAVGDVDVAVLATGKTSSEILDQICAALGLPAEPGQSEAARLERLHAHLAGREPVTIVVDALDEAQYPPVVLTDVLKRLTGGDGQSPVRLIVGVRATGSDGGTASDTLADATVQALQASQLRADAEPYWDPADLVDYIMKLLRHSTPAHRSPYADQPGEKTRRLAETIAELARTSYLLARIVAQGLADQDEVRDPGDAVWRTAVGEGLRGILRDELADAFREPADRRRAATLLSAAALAFGRGVPRQRIWPSIANALDVSYMYGDTDITWILHHRLGGYLLSDVEDGQTVYRPFHDALRPVFTDLGAAELLSAAAPDSPGILAAGSTGVDRQHGRITVALRREFEVREFGGVTIPPDLYLCKHLAGHAAAAGQLDELIQDPTFLAYADPDHLRLALLTSGIRTDTATTYRSCDHLLAVLEPAARASQLELAAHERGHLELAGRLAHAFPRRPYRTAWTSWGPEPDGRPLHGHTGFHAGVSCLAVGEADGRSVLVSGGLSDGTLRRWDLVTGAPIGEPLLAHTGGVSAVAVAEVDGRSMIVSAGRGREGTLRRWDLATGAPIGEPRRAHAGGVTGVAVGEVDGRSMIVSGSDDGVLRRWDLATGDPVGRGRRAHAGGVSAVAVAKVDGRSMIVSGGGDGTVRRWDLATGTRIGEPLTGDSDAVSCVAVGEVDGRPMIVSGDDDGGIWGWDLATGDPIGEPLKIIEGVSCLAVGEVHGRPMIAGNNYHRIAVLDAAPGDEDWELLGEASGSIQALILAEAAGRSMIISGDSDGAVRRWNARFDGAGAPTTAAAPQKLLALAGPVKISGGVAAVVSGDEYGFQRWDAATGVPIKPKMERLPRYPGKEPVGVAVGEVDGRPVIVGTDWQTVRRWDAATVVPIEPDYLHRHTGLVSCVAMGDVSGRPMIVSGSRDGSVRRWDAGTGAPIKPEPSDQRGRIGWVTCVAVGKVGDQSMIVSGGSYWQVRCWDAATGAPIEPALTGHTGEVSSVAMGEVDGRSMIVSGSDDGTVRRWDPATGTPIEPHLPGHSRGVSAVAIGELDGRPMIVSVSRSGMLRCWNPATGEQLGPPIDLLAEVTALVIGDSIYAATERGLVCLEPG